MKKCPECNSMVEDSMKVCSECGYPFPEGKECPECHEFCKDTFKHCPNCGYNFVGESNTVEENAVSDELNEKFVESDEVEAQPVAEDAVNQEVAEPEVNDDKLNDVKEDAVEVSMEDEVTEVNSGQASDEQPDGNKEDFQGMIEEAESQETAESEVVGNSLDGAQDIDGAVSRENEQIETDSEKVSDEKTNFNGGDSKSMTEEVTNKEITEPELHSEKINMDHTIAEASAESNLSENNVFDLNKDPSENTTIADEKEASVDQTNGLVPPASEKGVEFIKVEPKKDEKKSFRSPLPDKLKFKNKKPKFNKRTIIEIAGVIVLLVTMASYSNANSQVTDLQGELEKVQEKNDTLREDNKELKIQMRELKAKVDEYEHGPAAQLIDIKNAYEKQNWSSVVSLAKKLHEKYNGCTEDVEAQKLAKTAQEKLDKAAAEKKAAEEKAAAEKAAAEKKAAEEKAAEEARGYETGITYDQLARTPDTYIGKKVKFYGKVLQVMEGDSEVEIRLAVNGDYNAVIYGAYDSSIVSSRVLEDDYITIYGVSAGTITYKSTLGGNITIPGVLIDKIAQ